MARILRLVAGACGWTALSRAVAGAALALLAVGAGRAVRLEALALPGGVAVRSSVEALAVCAGARAGRQGALSVHAVEPLGAAGNAGARCARSSHVARRRAGSRHRHALAAGESHADEALLALDDGGD